MKQQYTGRFHTGLLCMIKRKEVNRLEIPDTGVRKTFMYSVEINCLQIYSMAGFSDF